MRVLEPVGVSVEVAVKTRAVGVPVVEGEKVWVWVGVAGFVGVTEAVGLRTKVRLRVQCAVRLRERTRLLVCEPEQEGELVGGYDGVGLSVEVHVPVHV